MSQLSVSVPNRTQWFDSMLNLAGVYSQACKAEGIAPHDWLLSSLLCAGLQMTHTRRPPTVPTCPAREHDARVRIHDRVMNAADDTETEMHDEQVACLAAWAGRRH